MSAQPSLLTRGPTRIPGWGATRPSITEQVGMHRPGPGDYLTQLGPKFVDPMMRGFDRCVPRQGVEL